MVRVWLTFHFGRRSAAIINKYRAEVFPVIGTSGARGVGFYNSVPFPSANVRPKSKAEDWEELVFGILFGIS
jgi:hypothetical protein